MSDITRMEGSSCSCSSRGAMCDYEARRIAAVSYRCIWWHTHTAIGRRIQGPARGDTTDATVYRCSVVYISAACCLSMRPRGLEKLQLRGLRLKGGGCLNQSWMSKHCRSASVVILTGQPRCALAPSPYRVAAQHALIDLVTCLLRSTRPLSVASRDLFAQSNISGSIQLLRYALLALWRWRVMV